MVANKDKSASEREKEAQQFADGVTAAKPAASAPEPGSAEQWQGEEHGGLENAPVAPVPGLRIVQGGMRGFGVAGHPLEKATPGQVWLTGTDFLAPSVLVVPAYMASLWAEYYGLAQERGAPLAYHRNKPANARWVDGRGNELPSGNLVNQVHLYYVMIPHPSGEHIPCLVQFSKTNLGVSWDWLNRLRDRPVKNKRGEGFLALWSRTWRLQAIQKHEKERFWWGFAAVSMVDWNNPNDDMCKAARAFSRIASLHYRQMLAMERMQIDGESLAEDDIPF